MKKHARQSSPELIGLGSREKSGFIVHLREEGPKMRTFKLPKAWPTVWVRIDREQGMAIVLLNGKEISLPLSNVGDPRTLNGEVPGLHGWIEITRCSRLGLRTEDTYFYLHLDFIGRKFAYQRKTAILEISLSTLSGGQIYNFKELPKWRWNFMLRTQSCRQSVCQLFAALLRPWAFA